MKRLGRVETRHGFSLIAQTPSRDPTQARAEVSLESRILQYGVWPRLDALSPRMLRKAALRREALGYAPGKALHIRASSPFQAPEVEELGAENAFVPDVGAAYL